MAFVSVRNLSITFGDPSLLDGIDLHIEEGDRLCLLGRNGTGKTTLLKIMAGIVQPDEGEVMTSKGVQAAYLGQEIPRELVGSAVSVASGGSDERLLPAEQVLTLFGIDPRRSVSEMSGGETRRVLLARVLASGADLLLLDEPTNHLDIDTIVQLEEYLLKRVKTFLFVTHDRAFARRVSNRVAEIDRGSLYAFDDSYDKFLERREEILEAQERTDTQFDKRLAEEEAWLRRGVKARRTRDEGRVRALEAMRQEYRARRRAVGNVKMELHQAERTGKLVIEAKGLSFAYEEGQPIVDRFSTMILRGDRVGIVGPNGSGKTTLLKLLLKELEPDSGAVRHGTNLRPLYLDQMRGELDPDSTVMENVAPNADTVEMNGRKRHVIGYLKDFLFPPERAKSPVAHLSGGERNRLLLAKLFARPSNLLIFDEPTNDLDMETLELLEELLQEYEGTLLLVSHDRTFLDNVVTDCFVLAGSPADGGRIIEYAGGYSDWRESEAKRMLEESETPSAGDKATARGRKPSPKSKTQPDRPRKLTFKERMELETLPDAIVTLEKEKETIHDKLADPELYRSESGDPAAVTARLEAVEIELAEAYRRWEELDGIAIDS